MNDTNCVNARPRLGRIVNGQLKRFGLTVLRTAQIQSYEDRLGAAEVATADYQVRLREAKKTLASTCAEYQARIASLECELERRRQVEADLHSLRGRLAPVAGQPLRVYLTDDLRPATQTAIGPSPHRIVVCSIPKAGTYLVHRLLELLGCVSNGLHVSSNILTDYRFASRREAREEFEQFLRPIPLDRSAHLLLPGQFTVGHLECSDYVRQSLSGCKKIFVYRNLRDALVSFLRFLGSTGRGGEATKSWKDLPAGPEQMLRFLDCAGESYFNMTLPMIDWLDDDDVLKVDFETLYGDHGESPRQALIDNLCSFLELPAGTVSDVREFREKLIGAPTMTWSGGRASHYPYWNDEVERRFIAFGGLDANRRLGYGETRTVQAADAVRRAA